MQILDCTLRDGSYAVNFRMSAELTKRVSSALNGLGIPYIEVGHGVGLGASERGFGRAACTDQKYMEAAQGNWGMFCIPGIAELDDVTRLADMGGKFIRIGCEIAKVDEAPEFIEHARKQGLYVFSNLMKSYAVKPKEFADAARKCVDAGAQCIYIVDSAGSMLKRHIFEYWRELKIVCPGTDIGFHGHNNLGCAVANALSCVQMGINVIDCTLQGIGRSGGNVPLEQFLGALMASKRNVQYDLFEIMRLGEAEIKPLLRDVGLSPLDVTAGITGFHSSYMPLLLEVSAKYNVDPLKLMYHVTKISKTTVSLPKWAECAQKMNKDSWPYDPKQYFGEEQDVED